MNALATPSSRGTTPARHRSGGSWHDLHARDALRLLDVDVSKGLATEEATRRRKTHGPNRISRRGQRPGWLAFLRQFHQPLVYILLAAGVVTAWLGERTDSIVILGVVVINAIVGFLQEEKAGKAIEALSRLVVTESKVRRDGRKQAVRSDDLVPGDVVLLHAGDKVPADLRLLLCKGLQIDESALTGESVSASKHANIVAADTLLADRQNLAFAGTLVTAGQAEGVVWATGDRTETGRIARLVADAVEIETPLLRKISKFSRLLLWVILVASVATFAIGVARGKDTVEMFMAAVALAVGAIPEGLPAAMTIVLAVGVARMARRRAIIRKLPAVETLGSTTVICVDKTGTLTENQMTVREIFAGGEFFKVMGSGYKAVGAICNRTGAPVVAINVPALAECLRAGIFCNDAQFISDEDGHRKVQGDPTEAALLVSAEKGGLHHLEPHRLAKRVDMIDFDSAHMFRATLHDTDDGRMIYKVGAVEKILDRCAEQLDCDGTPAPIDRAAVLDAVAQMATRGERVLAFARRRTHAGHSKLEHSHVASGLTFLGLQGMIDPPRAEVPDAVQRCLQAGIKVKMITGDHAVTAMAVARQIGLASPDRNETETVLTGLELDRLSDEELNEAVETTAIFARVAPEEKLRLVRALQARGHVVAMTGDGVNDAPALKQADIGVAMGLGGTEVAKGAASMILTDDSFASIEAAVEEGRGVFDNLRKFLICELPTNAGEGLILMTAILLGIALPALPVQFLWVNLTTSVFLGLALVFEPKEQGLMQRPPRDPRQPLLTAPLIVRTLWVSLMMLMGAYWLFHWELQVLGSTLESARTSVINVVVLIETAYLFNCRSLHRSAFSTSLFNNPWAIAGALLMVGAQLLFTYAPVMNRWFHTAPISGEAWLRTFAVAVGTFVAVEIEKWISQRRQHGSESRKVTPF
jgi:cation-transporting ATPase F